MSCGCETGGVGYSSTAVVLVLYVLLVIVLATFGFGW
ncbi:sporulation protein YjcZ [Paenibacillus plantarum]|nr:sporulation protein YjcZ [Paenibacillus plantarum]